ncbi:hypothetical protein G9C98_002030 [Cotesia typhae]|uniref:Uncharacterized protein n=1 Tax=Cotesia typhae TaxID=2053667 RepID=A0A8J5UTA4_9HYME|nr:hypothetical protein G9C98_002030 [Cotesia typhae]
MTRGDHIVMALDWSLIAKESYLGVVASVEAVDFCSHHRSWIFYAESLLSEKAFLAVRCSSNGKPSSTDLQIIPMGYATPREARGNYCLITSAQKPYGLQMDGAKEQ